MRSVLLSLPTILLLFVPMSPAAPPDEKPARRDAAGDPLPDGAVVRLGTTRFRTGDSLAALAMSPDGKLLAAAGPEEGVRLLDAVTGKPVRKIDCEIPPAALTFSPDGKLLAGTGGGNANAQLWDTATGRVGHSLTVPQGQVSSVVFSGDGKLVCGLALGSTIRAPMPVWETATGKLVASLPILHSQPAGASLSADGKLLAVCGQLQPGLGDKTPPEEAARTVQLWDIAKAKELRRLVVPSGSFTNVALSPDGKTVAASWGTCTLVFFDAATGKELRRHAIRRGVSTSLLYSPDGKYLAGASDGGPVQLWDAATGKRLGCYEFPLDPPARPCFAGGKALAYGATDKAVIIYDLLARKLLTPAGGHTETVQSLTFRAGGKELVSASADGAVCAWDAAAGKELRRSEPRPDADDRGVGRGEAGNAVLSPDGRHLLTDVFGEARLLDAATGEALLTLEGGGGVLAGSFSADGSQFAVAAVAETPGARAPALRVYETATGREVHKVGEGAQPAAVTFAPDGKSLAAVVSGAPNAPAELRAWDLTTGKQLWQSNLSNRDAERDRWPLAFSADGKALACEGEGGALVVYDGGTGRELRSLPMSGAAALSAVRFSPDGRLLAAGYAMSDRKPSCVRVWELATGTARLEFTGHIGEVTALAFSPDGKRLASGSADTTVLVWDLTGRAGDVAREKVAAEELDKLWGALADPEGRAAHLAMRRLEASPEEAVALLAKQVKPAEGKALDAAAVAKLIAALDAESFDERENAGHELEALGRGAEPALRKALAGAPSAEAKRRVEGLLDKLRDNGAPPPELVRPLRAVEVLEHVGTPEARNVLEGWAKGAADAPLTAAAKEALERLGRNGK